MLSERRSGILLHPTSLPGRQAVGSLGKEAYAFIDKLVEARQSVWQILPLGPTGYGDCPYSCFSAFAGNPLLIDFDLLVQSGELKKSDLPPAHKGDSRADFAVAARTTAALLDLAFANFQIRGESERRNRYLRFCEEQAHWLGDYALFQTLRELNDLSAWNQWPAALRLREPAALEHSRADHQQRLQFHQFVQFIFFDQWFSLKRYANERGVLIFGDLPIFVAEDSADVWAHQNYFHLDQDGKPSLVAGVPPDYFSQTGQRWGNPLYRWDNMAHDGFSWWKTRLRWNLALFDQVRIDHFRGFSGCWTIPAEHATAEHGYWAEVPGQQLFDQLRDELGDLPLIAEDLGIITPDVSSLRERYRFPGMKILQFAFDSGADNPYLPHNLTPNSVTYTGTHDNNTTLGWWREIDATAKQRIKDYLRNPCHEMPWPLIETAIAGVSMLAIIPMQDILSLSASERMNVPGTSHNNWLWRMKKDAFTCDLTARMKNLSHLYGRNLCIPTEM